VTSEQCCTGHTAAVAAGRVEGAMGSGADDGSEALRVWRALGYPLPDEDGPGAAARIKGR